MSRTLVTESAVAPAVVGALSFVTIRPGPNVILCVKQVIVPADAVFRSLSCRIARAKTLDPLITSPKAFCIAPEEGPDATRTTRIDAGNDPVTFTGNGLFGITVPANGNPAIYEFPGDGLRIYGDNADGVCGLLIQENTTNRSLQVGFVAFEVKE